MQKDYIRVVVRGIILVEGCILIARCKGATTTFLPGGHVEFGESLPVALARELLEEVGLDVQVSHYLGMVEHQWLDSDRQRHQINHIFAVSLPSVNVPLPLESHEDHLEFLWVQPSKLSMHNLLPSPLIELVKHFINGDRSTFWRSTFATPDPPKH